MLTTKIDHSLATLRVFIDGLSLVVEPKNPALPESEAIEILFLDKEHPDVEFLVDDIWGRRVWQYPTKPDDPRHVRVEISNDPSQAAGRLFKYGPLPPSDQKDYRWMPDLNVWHSGGIKVKQTGNNHMSAKLVVRDALFYTEEYAVYPGIRTDVDTDSPVTIRPIGTIIGADVVGPKIKVSVKAKDPRTGRIYEVTSRTFLNTGGQHLMHVRYEGSDTCDHDPLHLLYDYFVSTAQGNRFKFEYERANLAWRLNGWVADSEDPEKRRYERDSEEAKKIPDSRRLLFNTRKDAGDAKNEFDDVNAPMSDQYACQGYGGGNGPPPDFP